MVLQLDTKGFSLVKGIMNEWSDGDGTGEMWRDPWTRNGHTASDVVCSVSVCVRLILIKQRRKKHLS